MLKNPKYSYSPGLTVKSNLGGCSCNGGAWESGQMKNGAILWLVGAFALGWMLKR
jgi:hypothetical protein